MFYNIGPDQLNTAPEPMSVFRELLKMYLLIYLVLKEALRIFGLEKRPRLGMKYLLPPLTVKLGT